MSTTAVAERMPPAIIELRAQLEQRAAEFRAALPSHIATDHFQRVVLTAIQQNPKLLTVERRSLFNALMRAAQDGLEPDGRDAVLVVYRDRNRGEIAQYMPMVAGIRRLMQQSGEIVRFEQYIIYENDPHDVELGDRPRIMHRPNFTGPRGKPFLVYSIAEHRTGALSREVMTVNEIERARASSSAPDSPAWRNWWPEMAKKTVAKRHAKVLPRASRLDLLLEREDGPGGDDEQHNVPDTAPRKRGRPRLAAALDKLGAPPPGTIDEAEAVEVPPHDADGVVLDEDPRSDGRSPGTAPPTPGEAEADTGDGDFYGDLDPDVRRGMQDARSGLKACLDKEIRRDERRLHNWQQGYEYAKGSGTP
jgi:recombination protein RecT